jgi:hypothetical protein
MVFAGSAPGIQIMNPAPAFCNRLTFPVAVENNP